MKQEIEKVIKVVAKTALEKAETNTLTENEALKYTQAILNATNALMGVSNLSK